MTTSSKHVLIIDDEPDLLELLVFHIRSWGYKTTTANSSEQALQILDSGTVDILLSDIRMPGTLDGFQLLAEVKKSFPGVAVLLMSGYVETSEGDVALSKGASAIIRKPFEFDELKSQLSRL